jgi:molybdopterin molybdotransferase
MTPLDAFTIVTGSVVSLRSHETLPVFLAAGRIAAGPVRSPTALPRFDHSAVDGYGIPDDRLAADVLRRFELTSSVAAGDAAALPLGPGKAVKLATGAPVSAGVAAVVMQEHCRVTGNDVLVEGTVEKGKNIRRRGEDIVVGANLIEPGALLDARHVALLTAVGVAQVEVVQRLRVAVLSTGNELRPLGANAAPDEIYDANRPMLMALLRLPWIELVDAGIVGDNTAALAQALGKLAGNVDAVISSGGAGGSETDHIAAALVAAGGSARPMRIAQRPGKPLVIGSLADMPVLGLPGNTVAAMVNLHLYGLPMLAARAGTDPAWRRGQAAVTSGAINHPADRTDYAPARIVGWRDDGRPIVERLGQGAASLMPLLAADGLLEIGSGHGDVVAGGAVVFYAFATRFRL